jgi:hypothetical protein
MTGNADIILVLSRESKFPSRIAWDGKLTSYGPGPSRSGAPGAGLRSRRLLVSDIRTKSALKSFVYSPQQSEETKMDWNRGEGNWKQFKGKQWGK